MTNPPQPDQPQPGYPQPDQPQPGYAQPDQPQPGPPQGYAPGYPAPGAYAPPPPAGPPPAPAGPRPKGSATLGVISLVAAAVGTVVGAVLAFIASVRFGSLAQYDSSDFDAVQGSAAATEMVGMIGTATVLMVVAWLLYAMLALWGLIQGIVAATLNRGRGWGIAAIVVAALGWVALVTCIIAGTATGAGPYLDSVA